MANASNESQTKPYGSFVLMLHSHLPFYRKAGMWPFGEENLYECMLETYIPLLNALYDLNKEGIKANITVGLTPILVEQLADEHLNNGFVTYMKTLVAAAEKDMERYPDPKVENSEHKKFVATFYRDHFNNILDDYLNRYHGDLVQAFRYLQDEGAIEITTSAATHGFLPLLGEDEAIQGQLKTGIDAYKSHFGKAPKGIWLPECAYRPREGSRPSIDAFLNDNDINYFFTEFDAIEGSKESDIRRDFTGPYQFLEKKETNTREKRGQTGLTTYEAYYLKNYPVAVLGRNERASFQVWSAAHGYPGDGIYREFHKKDVDSGLNYWRITSKECEFGDKMLYDPIQALEQTLGHAQHYANLVQDLMKDYHDKTGDNGLMMVSFDTELYGHWWFEGVEWLKHVIRALNATPAVTVETASSYLENNDPKTAIDLPASSWGLEGSFWVWNNENTEWMWPVIHKAESTMKNFVGKYKSESNPQTIKILNQLYRELVLLEGSDWPFLVTTMQAKDYAIERFEEHVANFNALAEMLETGNVDEKRLEELVEKNNAFPNIDFRNYQYTPSGKIQEELPTA